MSAVERVPESDGRPPIAAIVPPLDLRRNRYTAWAYRRGVERAQDGLPKGPHLLGETAEALAADRGWDDHHAGLVRYRQLTDREQRALDIARRSFTVRGGWGG